MLTVTSATLARVSDLFRYKSSGFTLPPFPGYTDDQWGIKAHNRPWIEEAGQFAGAHRVLEVGGAYSRLPEYLGRRYGVEPWIADDFGMTSSEPMWARWGDPRALPSKYPGTKYVYRRLGEFASELPDKAFDRVFSVSTLEHIPLASRLAVLRDTHRLVAPGGMELHSIDIPVQSPARLMLKWVASLLPPLRMAHRRLDNEISQWMALFRASGVRIAVRPPSLLELLDRSVLVESPDVVYRFYPPNGAPKPYAPAASMLIVIQDL